MIVHKVLLDCPAALLEAKESQAWRPSKESDFFFFTSFHFYQFSGRNTAERKAF